MRNFELIARIRRGDLVGVTEILRTTPDGSIESINAPDPDGRTPLFHAAESPLAGADMVGLLIGHGASLECTKEHSALRGALSGGDPEKIRRLLSAGADIFYRDDNGYDALIHSAGSRNPRLPDVLKLLIDCGVSLNGVTIYQESALRILSHSGLWNEVRMLLDAGADSSQLGWTPLIRAVALGDLAEVDGEIRKGAPLEARDFWERTAWLVAILTGDIAKAGLLRDRGADVNTRGRCGQPPIFYAISAHQTEMLKWLIAQGQRVDQTDDFGNFPLNHAVAYDDLDCVDILLRSGANVNHRREIKIPGELPLPDGIQLNPQDLATSPLNDARSATVSKRLLDAGADPADLSMEGRRALLGLPPDPDVYLLEISQEDFYRGRSPRFGRDNPEEISEPFWQGMIRAGLSGYEATVHFAGPPSTTHGPVWCARRFGQTLTFLADGRIVQTGGEHEDSYDPDFHIYNDVFVHETGGAIRVFGYPESVFPPTDFHTATLVGDRIYLIGSLGYPDMRRRGINSVYCLDTTGFRIARLETTGDVPSGIHRHRATHVSSHEIRLEGGFLVHSAAEEERIVPNHRSYVIDLISLVWRIQSDNV